MSFVPELVASLFPLILLAAIALIAMRYRQSIGRKSVLTEKNATLGTYLAGEKPWIRSLLDILSATSVAVGIAFILVSNVPPFFWFFFTSIAVIFIALRAPFTSSRKDFLGLSELARTLMCATGLMLFLGVPATTFFVLRLSQ